jgi:tetratricopeptide (TPR) repeat protein
VSANTASELEAHARSLVRDGKLRDAATVCDALNQEFPGYAPGWYTTSKLALLVNEPLVGLEAIIQALRLSPGKPEWLLQQIECVGKAGDRKAATELAQELTGHVFDSPVYAAQFGNVLHHLDLLEDARRHYERACELKPDDGRYVYSLATVLHAMGDIDATERALDRCLQLNPDDPSALMFRANVRTQTEVDNNLAELETAYRHAEDNPGQRVRLCYALAKELEDVGEYRRSFAYLTEGAALRRQAIEYDLQSDLDTIYAIRDVYDAEQLGRDITGHINAEPIFLIGMPRSGSTLVERVLDSHSVVKTLGEPMLLPQQVVDHCMRLPDMPASSALDLANKSLAVDYAALGEDYITATRPAAGSTAHFVDTQPLNFMYVGFIRLALPKAKIVLLQRDPIDTCFAIFKTLFEHRHPYSCDLEELAQYFVAHRALTDHWLKLMPDAIHVVRLEELIANPRPVIEDLLEYCSLSFEESCLHFFDPPNSANPVPSQAYRAFSRVTIGKWKQYAEQLQPAVDILGKAGL